MSVSIRRRVTRNQGFTVIIFDKDHIYNWPTNIHEHNEILKLYKQDRLHEGIYNDHSELISHRDESRSNRRREWCSEWDSNPHGI